jgi:hypothetical protein
MVALSLLATAAYFILLSTVSATPVDYKVRDLGPLIASALNDLGQVTGFKLTTPNSSGAFITGPNGIGLRALGPLPSTDVYLSGINNSGQVSGTFLEGNSNHPFVTGPNGVAPRDLGINGP